jgi:4-diphosphocytidyl-2C-methyl-D-erythritol kinase
VYRKFDEMKLGRVEDLQETPWSQWSRLSANELLPLLVNDLEAPAFALKPELAELRGEISSRLSRPVRMSGSGSSLFTLFDSANDAQLAQVIATRQIGVKAIAVEIK